MDVIEKLLKDIKEDEIVTKVDYFHGRFVNTVGEIYEKYGYGATKAYLIDKMRDRDRKRSFEAKALLRVVDKVERANLPPSLGGFLIRKLITIKTLKEV